MKKFRNVLNVFLILALLFGVLPTLSVNAEVISDDVQTFDADEVFSNGEFESAVFRVPTPNNGTYTDISYHFRTSSVSSVPSDFYFKIIKNSPHWSSPNVYRFSVSPSSSGYGMFFGHKSDGTIGYGFSPAEIWIPIEEADDEDFNILDYISFSNYPIKYYDLTGSVTDFPPYGETPSRPSEKPTDGEYLWINSPVSDTKLSGYIGQTLVGDTKLKQFDIEVYGRYLSKNGLFDTVSGIKTSIINSFKLQYGDYSKSMGDGLGLKSFEWIVEPKNNEYAEFRIVLYAPMFKQGTVADLSVSCTVKRYDGEKQEFTDTVNNIEMLIDNYDDNITAPPPDGGSSGEVGGSGGSSSNEPTRPDDSSNILDWFIYVLDSIVYYIQSFVNSISSAISALLLAFQEITTEMTNAVSKFSTIFGMLPSPLPQLITLSTTVLCTTTIFRLIRR